MQLLYGTDIWDRNYEVDLQVKKDVENSVKVHDVGSSSTWKQR